MRAACEETEASEALLRIGEPSPVDIVNPDGSSPFLFLGDHAGRLIPAKLGTLGLGDEELSRHIGWDIGVGRLGDMLADTLDGVFIRQHFSRLVVDCNRDPGRVDAVPPVSDGTPVPGNEDLPFPARAGRISSIHEPYHHAIAQELDRRREAGRATILVSLHSFTPSLRTVALSRPWQIGVLHDGGDARFAKRLLKELRVRADLIVGENEPYAMTCIDYTVPRHAYAAGLPYAELEIRQDLLETDAALRRWAELLAAALARATEH